MRNRGDVRLDRRSVRQTELEVSIFVHSGDMHEGHPLHHEIIERARRAGLRGGTVVRGLQGFGSSAKLGPPGRAALTGREPVMIKITDEAGKVRAFLPAIEQVAPGKLIVLRTVTTVRARADLPDITTSALA